MHRTEEATDRCDGCDEAISPAFLGWWIVARAWEGARHTFCSSSCAAAFFEERERHEAADRARGIGRAADATPTGRRAH